MSIGRNLPHDSAIGHVTGESIFVDDRPSTTNEVHVGFVGTTVAAGVLINVDASEALEISGVLAVYTARDFYHNRWGTIVHDQPFLVEDVIGHFDEPVCLIAAETREALREARKKVRVEVEESAPIFHIDEAIARKLFLYESRGLEKGDAEKAIREAPHRLKGSFEIGGQEHFYLESQASIATPTEGGQIEIHSSTQHPTEVQHVVAEALGLQQSQVVCVVKRMGGAFGGKESQASPFAAMAALVASQLNRPARMALEKDDDMRITGKRHPFKNFYEVGFDEKGKILGLKVQLYSDGGAYLDLSHSVLERAVFHIDGAYFLENAKIEAAVCKTNHHSNTAFRGFGGPQGNMTIECILEEIAIFLKKDAFDVRRLNVYQGSNCHTLYNQEVKNNTLPELFDRALQSSNYHQRQIEIRTLNASQDGKLRGLAITACKFGIAFNARFLNQASALVNVNRDGSVQVSTGATEMGQGVNTKIRQIVASTFGVPVERVQMMATSTEKNSNTSPTAASSGTDLNGAASLVATNKIKARMSWVAHHLQIGTSQLSDFQNLSSGHDLESKGEPADGSAGVSAELSRFNFSNETVTDRKTGWSISWKDLVNKTYMHRISLGEHGFFRTEGLDYNNDTRSGNAFKYFTNGVCASEVEIDEYTGELKIRRVDLLMDIGCSINPGIDRGQVVGGFIQGVGWMTTESLWYTPKGRLMSYSPTTYKIPNIQDTPRDFRVEFLQNDGNSDGLFRSKAVGEPPLLLSASVLMAVKNALSYRTEGVPELRCPATPEEILMELSRKCVNTTSKVF